MIVQSYSRSTTVRWAAAGTASGSAAASDETKRTASRRRRLGCTGCLRSVVAASHRTARGGSSRANSRRPPRPCRDGAPAADPGDQEQTDAEGEHRHRCGNCREVAQDDVVDAEVAGVVDIDLSGQPQLVDRAYGDGRSVDPGERIAQDEGLEPVRRPGEGQGRNESIVEEARDPDVRVEVFEGAALEPDGRVAVEAAGRGDVDAQRIEEAAGRERNVVSIRAPPGSRRAAAPPLPPPGAATAPADPTP